MKLNVMERHDQLLTVWRQQSSRGIRLTHLDFHCDMNGLLVDQSEGRAYKLWHESQGVNQGNFISFAVFAGHLDSVRWVHDIPGGRGDDFKTVRYTTDLSVRINPFLLRRNESGVPFGYEVTTMADWKGTQHGEWLDIDWDVFACEPCEKSQVAERVDRFFSKLADPPDQISVCYSPQYSHPTRAEFEAFVSRLSETFHAEVVRLPPPPPENPSTSPAKRMIPPPLYRALGNINLASRMWLRQRGIF